MYHSRRPATIKIWTRRQASAYVATVGRLLSLDKAQPCEHGHFDCASREGGPCSDEVRVNFSIGIPTTSEHTLEMAGRYLAPNPLEGLR